MPMFYGYDQSKKSLAVAKENIRNKNISFGDELLEIKKFRNCNLMFFS